jgi:hypothetical protein
MPRTAAPRQGTTLERDDSFAHKSTLPLRNGNKKTSPVTGVSSTGEFPLPGCTYLDFDQPWSKASLHGLTQAAQ